MNDWTTLHNNFNEPFGSFRYIVMSKNGHTLTKRAPQYFDLTPLFRMTIVKTLI
jgi:hypothetical protein